MVSFWIIYSSKSHRNTNLCARHKYGLVRLDSAAVSQPPKKLVRSCYVVNMKPEFERPKAHTHNIPVFNQIMLKNIAKLDVALWMGFYCTPRIDRKGNELPPRKRRINMHRAAAIKELLTAIAYSLNILTSKVYASLEWIADCCGLSTTSEAGNKSITRISRAAETLREVGVISYTARFDKVSGLHFPAEIIVTDVFFSLIGIPLPQYESAKNSLLAYKNKELAKQNKRLLSKSEAIKEEAQRLHDKAWRTWKEKRDIKHAAKSATRKQAYFSTEKGKAELKHQENKRIQREIAEGKHAGLSFPELLAVRNRRIKFITTPPNYH